MNIKRYEPALLRHPIMREDPDGQWHHRADLIAAGCLVPVPDGEAKPFDDVDARFIEYNEHIYQWNEVLDHDKSAIPIYGGIPAGIRLNNRDMPVKPVRLVRLEDVG